MAIETMAVDLYALIAVPISMALGKWLKTYSKVPNGSIPLIVIGVNMALAGVFGNWGRLAMAQGLLQGLLVTGLYSGVKNTKEWITPGR